MKYRKLGRTGFEVSILSFGGLMLNNYPQDRADKIVAEAVENGINLFDVGPTYGDAEEKLGKAIKPYRDDIILTCKTEPDQSKGEVRRDLENSLKKLNTDYFEIYQLHEVVSQSKIDRALAPGKALEGIIEAREEGLIKYIGFSTHNEQAALKLMDAFDFDTVMFPVNWNYWLNDNQGMKVIEKAEETNKGVIAIKSLARSRWKNNVKKDGFETWYKPIYKNDKLSELAFKFTLSRNVDTAVSPSDIRMLKKAYQILDKNRENLKLEDEEFKKLKKYAEDENRKLFPFPEEVS